MENLESRTLMAVNTPVGYTPQQIRHAYNVDKIWYKNKKTGLNYKGTGEGQTIAIVDAYDHPRITSDFKIFNKAFGLPNYGKDGKLLLTKKVAPAARANLTAPVPRVDRGWAEEIALDVQWAHAMAPRAKIVLVEAQSATWDDFLMAMNTARNIPGVSVISLSLGSVGGELGKWQDAYDNYFLTPKDHIGPDGKKGGGITSVVSSGDVGAVTSWPAVSKNVLSVGGTNLTVDAAGNWLSESAWVEGGGGPPQFSNPNHSPHVAMVADPASGVAIYNSIPNESTGQTGWFQIGGTSASAPMWAGLLAVVNEGRTLLGKKTLDGVKDVLPWIQTNPSGSFHDIISGSNGFNATVGFDYATGIGTPKSHKVARSLILWDAPVIT
jgi:subtilase family serine protease